MKPPRHSPGNLDRHLECQEALEPRVLAILDEGRAAGWSTAEIATALVDLADHIMLSDAANRETDRAIEDALRRLGF